MSRARKVLLSRGAKPTIRRIVGTSLWIAGVKPEVRDTELKRINYRLPLGSTLESEAIKHINRILNGGKQWN